MINTLTHVDNDVIAEIESEKKLRKTSEVFLLFSLGSQFDHLIKMSLDRLGVYCLVADPAQMKVSDVKKIAPIGIVLSGGPASAHSEKPPFDERIFDLGIPTLGICLGFQLWAHHVGMKVHPATEREFGSHTLAIKKREELFKGLGKTTQVLQSHGDYVVPNKKLSILGSTKNAPVAAAHYKHLWGVQFHPEVTESVEGERMFHNFCFGICQAKDTFPAQDEAARKIAQIRETVGNKKVLLAISGGSDSSVVAGLLKKALKPGQVRGIYIKGVDRPDDEEHVHTYFGNKKWLDLRTVDATNDFLKALKGKTNMHEKRVALRGIYKKILEAEAKKFKADFIAQGTLYTDISESGHGHGTGARKAKIKLHHNVNLDFSVTELTPLDDNVKDSARQIGRSIGVAEELLARQPFPGPGLVVRIEGEVTAENLAIARTADGIYISELRKAGLYDSVWQSGAVVTHSVSTFTKGDDAGTGLLLLLWAIWSVNGFTAQWAELPYDFLRQVSQRITNEIPEIARVSYAVSDKPPATIEYG